MDRSLASFLVSTHILRRGPPHTFLFTSSLLDTEKDPWPIVLACYFPLWHSTRQQTGTSVDSDWMKLAEVHCIGCFSERPTATSRWQLRAGAGLSRCCGAHCRARCCLNRWACCSDWRVYLKWNENSYLLVWLSESARALLLLFYSDQRVFTLLFLFKIVQKMLHAAIYLSWLVDLWNCC